MKKRIWIELLVITGLFLTLVIGCKKGEGDTSEATTSSLFDNSFDKSTTYPTPARLTYARKNGVLVSDTIFPGQIVVLASDTSATAINQFITQNNGTITAQVPNAGLYLVTIDAANVNTFLAAMYKNSIVADAFPNTVIKGKGYLEQCGVVSCKGNKNSLIQTIDVSTDMGCSDKVYHSDAVGSVAAAGGVGVNVNDVTVKKPKTSSAGADSYKSMQKILELLNYSYEHNLPVVINISLGGDDNIELDNYWYHKRFCYLLQAVEKQNPHLLDHAVILMSGANANVNETEDFVQLKENDFKGSPIWDHFYFVESLEGPNGCGLGYVENGTANVLSAPACHIKIPNSVCTRSGNSFSTPYIASLIGQAFEMLKQVNINVAIPEITAKLWKYQKENDGRLPTAAELFSICAGDGGFNNKYDGTWSGTFYYTVEVPQSSGPPTIVNTSFTLSITLASTVSLPGYPQLLTVTSVTCSDPTFGATSPIVPPSAKSTAFLPATFGSASLQGMAITITFPNGSTIFTSNALDGSFTVDINGRVLASTSLVSDDAFLASGNVDNSNLPGSGPGGYAYNWCTFTSWSLVRH
ncbi:MAG: hypothetical protein PHF97_04245 [Bacteroidales bacterium]|nr:hypothetical protein [Bacteroidales bacterium]